VSGRNITDKARAEAETLMAEFGFRPTLYRLLCEENKE
jgi:hypothetical protein